MNPKQVPLSALLEINDALSAAINDIGDAWIGNAVQAELRRKLVNARITLQVRFDVPVAINVRDDVSEVA